MAFRTRRLRPATEDIMRAVGYAMFLGWALGFILTPPDSSVVSAIDYWSRVLWLSPVLLGSFAALVGALSGFDLKVEFPGIVFTLIGPILYAGVLLYLLIQPGDPMIYYPTLFYTALPGVLLLPRAHALYKEAQRLKRLNVARGVQK